MGVGRAVGLGINAVKYTGARLFIYFFYSLNYCMCVSVCVCESLWVCAVLWTQTVD